MKWENIATENAQLHISNSRLILETIQDQVSRFVAGKITYLTLLSLIRGNLRSITLDSWVKGEPNVDQLAEYYTRLGTEDPDCERSPYVRLPWEPIRSEMVDRLCEYDLARYEKTKAHDNERLDTLVWAVPKESCNKLTEKETTMNKTYFETIQYVNGTPIKDLNSNDLISAISLAESEVAELGTIRASSKAIDKRVDEINDQINKMVEVLDAK